MELRSVAAIAKALGEADVRYLVVGGTAVNAHGYQRFTSDLDLVVQLDAENVLRALNCLESLAYHPRVPITALQFSKAENRQRWHEEKGMMVLNLHSELHPRTPIDIFISEPFDFNTEWDLATKIDIEAGNTLSVVRLPTLLEMKKNAARPKDLLDLDCLTRLNPYRDGK